jgi:hypothetical protein
MIGLALSWRFRDGDEGLELVTASLAFPKMTYVMPVEISRPFWQEDRLIASGTVVPHGVDPYLPTTFARVPLWSRISRQFGEFMILLNKTC